MAGQIFLILCKRLGKSKQKMTADDADDKTTTDFTDGKTTAD
jgi:hypothetical protein